MAVYIPWSMFEPLPEWLRAPVVIGVFVAFGWVVLWAFRQRGRP